MKYILLVTALMVAACAPEVCSARTWHLYADGTGDAPSLREALEQSADRDTILLEVGNYSGDGLETNGKSLTIRGVVDEAGSRPVLPGLAFLHCDFYDIAGCSFSSAGVAVFAADGVKAVRIANCILEGGLVAGYINADTIRVTNTMIVNSGRLDDRFVPAGGLQLESGDHNTPTSITVLDCVFEGNYSNREGGAINACAALDGEILIERCLFRDNEASSAAAIYVRHCGTGTFDIRNNTFVRNRARDACVVTNVRGAIEGNIFAQNDCFAFDSINPTVDCYCNLMWGNWAFDNGWQGLGDCETGPVQINEDPLFCGDEGEQYYELSAGSPALEENFSEGFRAQGCSHSLGAFAEGCKVSPVLLQSWGSIKKTFAK